MKIVFLVVFFLNLVLAKDIELPASLLRYTSQKSVYQSGFNLPSFLLESLPSGNGDIGSAFKIMPNVQFDNTQFISNVQGEIDPANISVSGGLFYQNNFNLDGFNINNDLDPIGGGVAGMGGASQGLRGNKSQGFHIDTSLLKSLSLQDSNIGAAYGGFTGGVIEATLKEPRSDGFHGRISYQYTSDKLTRFHIDESLYETFLNSSDENNQPLFSKHLVKASFEGYLRENLGLIGSFSTTRSFIPLRAYSDVFRRNTQGTQRNSMHKQKRISDNYYLKAYYYPTENFNLETNLAYMPQNNSYFNNIAKDSFYTMKSGGLQSGIKGSWENAFGFWTNTLGYSSIASSRRSEKNYRLFWRYSQDDKNWAVSGRDPNLYASEGGVSDIDRNQNTFNYKSDMIFNTFSLQQSSHTFRLGFEINYQNVAREILKDYYYSGGSSSQGLVGDLQGVPCQGDIFGLSLCSTAVTSNNFNGQFIKRINVIKAGKVGFDTLSYGTYLEDDIKWDLNQFGILHTRFGIRLDGDDYMRKKTLAPRLSINYTAPWQTYASSLISGINRYYGRNLFSYRLYDSIVAATSQYNRTSIDSQWVLSDIKRSSGFKFSELDVPYDDEFVLGFNQNIWLFNVTLKHIYRQGKDEIIRRRRTPNNAPALDNYSSSYNFYTNDGSSQSHITTLMLSNSQAIESFGIKHYYLLSFDLSDVKRSYNLFAADELYYDNEEILYDGKVIRYRERPTENYNRPYTLRLNTIHTFTTQGIRWLLNNFLRYRASYERMIQLSKNDSRYDSNFDGNQYVKAKIKGAFSWDMRVGFEFGKKNIFFMNVDIYNILNRKNMTSLSRAGTSTAVAVYEAGRQFWLEAGYKF
ncbi:TonB-dependent receptor [Campylobacter sp. MIT 21-1685]|uniref:TonB-dependent receptor n=1 Tax=unclassified Campylobacter TaxID=2593542 RepID=UPI00224AC0EB|nr:MULTISPECIES: TonB-dependent receptor [unclassified Campylobacter]MCX2683791.1 TonB-dependent receptor [Campylobacter sp. MIT 21-1684]MCX2752076.1 TonB-dependent receptor [Campylobacter sp. MIT 21-1682]MCX2808269.1 TonB-dependent receptor [Campylobacter sp. MIT 21-1685]